METVKNKGVTKIDTVEVNYSWTVENFLLNGKNEGHFIDSPSFSSDSNETKWFMRLYPKGWAEKPAITAIFVYLQSNTSKKTVIEADVKFSILCSVEKNINQTIFLFDITNSEQSAAGFRLANSNSMNEYLVNGNLTIICRLRYGSKITNSSSMNSNLEKLIEDFEKLMDKPESCDITLVASGERIPAHKVILAARSPVFSALFSHNMRENKEKLITIEDAEPDIVKEMLRFMYTGKVQNLGKLAYELLSLSDKYALDGLREMCEESLCENITIENAINILVLSDLHSAKILKKCSMTFIKTYASIIINTEAYKTLEKSNPSLIAELLRFIVSKR